MNTCSYLIIHTLKTKQRAFKRGLYPNTWVSDINSYHCRINFLDGVGLTRGVYCLRNCMVLARGTQLWPEYILLNVFAMAK